MFRLGIDLGGTNIAVAVVDENYNIVGRAKTKTDAQRPAAEICDSIAFAAKEAIKSAGLKIEDIVAAGIGTPGSVIPSEGIVTYTNNFACFNNLPLCAMLKERLGIDFYIENDANAAAYGEYLAGAGVGTNDFVAVTLGTGVGGGVIIGGKMLLGSNFAGGELGHTELHLDLFNSFIWLICFNRLQDRVQLIPKKHGDHGRRGFVCAETMVIARSGD